jgi:hypothetical protein
MAPKKPQDKEQIGRVGEAGLFVVSDRTPVWEWQSFPREQRRQRDRSRPLDPWKPNADGAEPGQRG